MANSIREYSNHFEIAPVEHDRNLSHHDWFVDTADDHAFVKGIFDVLYRDDLCFGKEEVLSHLNTRRPEHR